MRIVVDTNIIFSAVLNSNGLIGDLLFNSGDLFSFFAPEFILEELDKYKFKLQKITNLPSHKVDQSIQQVLKNVQLISMEAISTSSWENAHFLARDIDEKDTPFLATALSLEASLWTGDKKLINGLRRKGFQKIYSTSELFDSRR